MRKIISFFLTVCILSGLCATALAVEDQPTTFRDVPAGHWAYTYIKQAADLGFVSGYSDGTYRPDERVTYAQFAVMLGKALYPDELAEQPLGATWWEAACSLAHAKSLFARTDMANRQVWSDTADKAMERQAMAQMMYNALKATGAKMPSTNEIANAKAAIGDFGDINALNSDAVAACYAAGLLSGSNGMFNPKDSMTRAQAAVVLCNVYGYVTGDVVGSGSPLKPYEPSEPVAPTQPVTPVTPVEPQEPVVPSKPVGPKPSGALGGHYDTSVYNVPADTNKDGWITEAEVKAVIDAFMEEYPIGTPWGEEKTYVSPNWGTQATACAAFSQMLSDRIFGDLPKHQQRDAYSIRIGDAFRTLGTNGHWGTVHYLWWYDEDPSQGIIRTYEGNVGGEVGEGGTTYGDVADSLKVTGGNGMIIWTRFPQE